LEEHVEVILVNPKHFKNLRVRKTDISDSRWLAGLLRHGLLKGGFIPPKFQRQWRDLIRMRTRYVQTQGDFKRRVHKLFQHSNIKIDSVVTHLFGLTGRNIMNLLLSKDSSPSVSEVRACLRGSLSHKATELHRAVQGFFEEHHREMLRMLLQTIDTLEDQIRLLDQRIDRLMKEYQDALDRLKEVPGVSDVSARAILSEIGPGLEAFPTAGHLPPGAGCVPATIRVPEKDEPGTAG
jgi:transposase